MTARVLRAPGGAARAAFEPTLADRVPADAAGMLALPGVDAMAAIAERAGGAALLSGLEEALPTAAGIELEDLLAPLGDEAALTVQAGEAAPSSPSPRAPATRRPRESRWHGCRGPCRTSSAPARSSSASCAGPTPSPWGLPPSSSRPMRSRRAPWWPPRRTRGWSSSARRGRPRPPRPCRGSEAGGGREGRGASLPRPASAPHAGRADGPEGPQLPGGA